MNNAFLDQIYLDAQELESKPWQAYYKYHNYSTVDIQERGLLPLEENETTLLQLYSQVSSPEIFRFLRMKEISSDIKDTDEENFNEAFKSVNPYMYGFLGDYEGMLRNESRGGSCDGMRILDFDTQFSLLAPLYAIYDDYFEKMKQLNYVAPEVVFTVVIASETRYFQIIEEEIKERYQRFYEELKSVKVCPPGKFIFFSSFAQAERQFPNTDSATIVETPVLNYMDDIDQIPRFIDRIRLETSDLGAKLLILDNLDAKRSDICLSISQNFAMLHQLFIQTAVAVAPEVVISNGCCLLRFREICGPVHAALLQILSNFYNEVSYFRPNFGRAIEEEKWVYCGRKKRVDKNIANSVVGSLINYSKQIKKYDIPVDIGEKFVFPKHFLPIRGDLVTYCENVNNQHFKLQERILMQAVVMYARQYDKLELIREVMEIYGGALRCVYQETEIPFEEFIQQCVENNPKIGLLFPSNEKREIMVYRYISRINPEIQRFDLQFILYDMQRSKTVRFESTEIKRQSVRVAHVESQQEKEELARIERERLEKEKKELAERQKQNPEEPPEETSDGNTTTAAANTNEVTFEQHAPMQDMTANLIKEEKQQEIKPNRPEKHLFMNPKPPEQHPGIEPEEKPSVRRAPAVVIPPGKFEGKNVLKGKLLSKNPPAPERLKDPPKQSKKKEKNLLANVKKYIK